MRRREFLATVPAVATTLSASPAQAATGTDLKLWFRQPAAQWVDALPLGNGRIGAMVTGGVERERVYLNCDTLWSGAPRQRDVAPAPGTLDKVRQLILKEHNYVEADKLTRQLQGPFSEAYMPLGELLIDFDQHGAATDYRLELDLDTATCRTSYTQADVRYKRESFVSAPDGVMVTLIEGDKPASVNCTVQLTSPLRHTTTAEGPVMRLQVKAPAHAEPNYRNMKEPITYSDVEGQGMRAEALLVAVASGGRASIKAVGDTLRIENANSLTLLLTAETGFRGYAQLPDTDAEAIHARCDNTLVAARAKTHGALRAAHVADHRALFGRVALELPTTAASKLPTDERLARYKSEPEAALAALYFQYGRYLLIASSRRGSQPANLQGIWNDSLLPPWSSNYTSNINVQMNYWHAETTNLTECHEPMFDFIDTLSHTGATTARVAYGLNGWVTHHNTDIWRMANAVGAKEGDPRWANWAMAAPWLCEHLWEHFLFTGDFEFLAKRAWPAMRGAAEFLLGWLVDNGKGGLTTCPSTSPENGYYVPGTKDVVTVDAGCTMDRALIRELFGNCISATRILGNDDGIVAKLEAALRQLAPFQKGSQGQLLEWSQEFAEPEPGHRHMSHLYTMYPSALFTWTKTPEWMLAAKQSLELRLKNGGGHTGWSAAWIVCHRARLREGAKAGEALSKLFTQSTNRNLFDTHPAGEGKFIFQIDGNFGATAGMAEMLLQSHDGEITLLPALPPEWATGRYAGLRARGGLTVDVEWRQLRATRATLRPMRNASFTVRPPKGQTIQSARVAGRELALEKLSEGRVRMALEAGTTVELQFG